MATVEERNEAFHKAPKEEQCVMIALEVLHLLDKRRFVALRGQYITSDSADDFMPERMGRPVSYLINNNLLSKCFVCAMGAACLAAGNLEGNTTLEGIMGDWNDNPREPLLVHLKQYFPEVEIDRLEGIFETSKEDSELVLRRLMADVVDNNGHVPV